MCDMKALGPLLGHCGHLGRERMDARLSQNGIDITPVQTHVLLYLHHHGGQAPQCDVTAQLKVKPSTANGVLDRMEEKGLVQRSVSAQDARRRLITLTEKGRARQEQFKAAFLETEAVLTRGLTEEEAETLHALLLRVICNLEEDRKP